MTRLPQTPFFNWGPLYLDDDEWEEYQQNKQTKAEPFSLLQSHLNNAFKQIAENQTKEIKHVADQCQHESQPAQI